MSRLLSSTSLVALGLAVGWAGARLDAPVVPGPTSAAVPGTSHTVTVTTPDTRELRRIVREALAAALPAQAAPEAATAAPVPAEPTADQLTAEASAQELLDGAIGRGAWTDDDRTALRALAGQLSREQLEPLLSELTVAVNNGEVTPTFPLL